MDTRDRDGGRLPSGVYLCRLEVGAIVRVRKIMLVR